MMQSKRFLPSLLALVCGLTMLNGVRLTVLAQSAFTIERVSVDSDEMQLPQHSLGASMSVDGRFVFFANTTGLLVRDRVLGETSIAAADLNGQPVLASPCWPGVSGDGRYVAFSAGAGNVVLGDTNHAIDIFVRDRETGEITRVSIASNGIQANARSYGCAISSTGRYVVFDADASNLVANDTNNADDVFVHDRETGETVRVSVASDGAESDGRSQMSVISDDGRFVAFASDATNFVSGDTNSSSDIFVHNRDSGETVRVSVASNDEQAEKGSVYPSLSGDGRYVAFQSEASNLVADDNNNTSDVFVHDQSSGQTTLISVSSDEVIGNSSSSLPKISANGQYVVFLSFADILVDDDTNGFDDIFVRDRDLGQTYRVSIAVNGAQANLGSDSPNISADGKIITFQSRASNLVPNDTNNAYDVFAVVLNLEGETTPQPTDESTPESTPEVTTEPTEEPTPEITPEITQEPTDEPTPEATDAPDANPHRTVFTTHTPTLTWNRLSWTLRYDIQIATTTNFSTSLVYEGSTTGAELEHLVTQSLNDGRYYWRVRGVSASRAGNWSRPDEFFVDAD